jgi:hypothetical protein
MSRNFHTGFIQVSHSFDYCIDGTIDHISAQQTFEISKLNTKHWQLGLGYRKPFGSLFDRWNFDFLLV